MGKLPSSKKRGDQSLHSRAARRATSPSINTDKSLKEVKLPSESSSHKPNVLSAHRGAGIVKASKRGRKSVLSAKARRRQEKALDRAESVMAKTAVKVEKSKGSARKVQERAKAWEDLNKKALEGRSQKPPLMDKENSMDLDEGAEQDEDTTSHIEDAVLDGVEGIQIQSPPSLNTAGMNTTVGGEEEEEIL